MGSDVKKSYNAEGRDEMLWFDPSKLILVSNEASALYDERVDLPLNEKMVLNVMVHGVIKPIIVRLNGKLANGDPNVEVIDGRQRVRHAIEANKRLVAEGKEAVRVPAIRKRGEDHTVFGLMIAANEFHQGDGPLVRARKLQRYLAMGRSEEEAAITFGVTRQTVKNNLAYLELAPAVQKKVEAEGIAVNTVMPLLKLPKEEQAEALEKLIEAGATKGAKGMEAAKRVRDRKEVAPVGERTKMRKKELLESVRTILFEGKAHDDLVAWIDFSLGKAPKGLDPEVMAALASAGWKEKAPKKEKVVKPPKVKKEKPVKVAKKKAAAA